MSSKTGIVKNTILFIFLFVFSVSSSALAEIGGDRKKFRQSEFVKTTGFLLDSTADAGPFSTTPGSEKFYYKSKDGRYALELVANKAGENILSEELSFPYTEELQKAAKDRECAFGFIKEATTGEADKVVFDALYDKALKIQGLKHEAESSGFIISIAVYKHALYKEWSIEVKRK